MTTEIQSNPEAVQTARIAQLNDALRTTGQGGQILITAGIADGYSQFQKFFIMKAIARFNDFNEDNDPHEEHDFGAVLFEGAKIFWKIDYYAPDMMHGSEDPSDPEQTSRVMTVMLASEY
jgi:hypothetical protein